MSEPKTLETSEMPKYPNVEIAVKNFGPIAEATIDLRPLTVFVGPSNTGKTYFSTLIYALHGVFNSFPQLPSIPRKISYLSLDRLLSSRDLEEFRLLLKQPNTLGDHSKFSDLPKEIRDMVQSEINDLGKSPCRAQTLL